MKTNLHFFSYNFVVIFLILSIISCGPNSKHKSNDPWGNAVWTNLEGELIRFRKPISLKKSSRYRIKEDLPVLASDSTKLFLFQKTLESLEFEDKAPDVFVDTTTNYRVIIICNVARINFKKNDLAILKKGMENQHQELEQLNPTLDYGPVKAKYNQNQTLKLAKFKTELTNLGDQSKVYNSIYYLTSPSYTLVVYEFSDIATDIEKYLWSVKT